MSRFVPATDLDAEIASKILAPRIAALTGRVEDEAKHNAPDGKTWVTAHDERVRPSHAYADGQEVPDNLRYKIPKVNTGNDINDIRAGFDLATAPRDPNLPIGNRINCRCESLPVPGAVAHDISKTDAAVMGTKVRASVVCTYPRAAEAEYGTDEDSGTHFMSDALHTVATESQT